MCLCCAQAGKPVFYTPNLEEMIHYFDSENFDLNSVARENRLISKKFAHCGITLPDVEKVFQIAIDEIRNRKFISIFNIFSKLKKQFSLQARTEFNKYDLDHSGEIEKHEFKNLMQVTRTPTFPKQNLFIEFKQVMLIPFRLF